MSNKRRQFSRDFKMEAVRIVMEGGQSASAENAASFFY